MRGKKWNRRTFCKNMSTVVILVILGIVTAKCLIWGIEKEQGISVNNTTKYMEEIGVGR